MLAERLSHITVSLVVDHNGTKEKLHNNEWQKHKYFIFINLF